MKWIPVRERLPDEDGKYLVYIPTMDEEKPYIGIAWYHPGLKYKLGWSLLPILFIKAITHWMPLPIPPEKDNES